MRDQEYVRISATVPRDLRTALKIRAATWDVPVGSVIEELLLEALEQPRSEPRAR